MPVAFCVERPAMLHLLRFYPVEQLHKAQGTLVQSALYKFTVPRLHPPSRVVLVRAHRP